MATTTTEDSIAAWLAASPFQGYAYAYPHKTAYRPLATPVSLGKLWAQENRQRLFLYVHVPFCEMRCGFCNLFTTSNPDNALIGRWLTAMERQVEATAGVLGADARFARGAIGGGTPTFLEVPELDRLLRSLQSQFGTGLRDTIFSVEMSPATVTVEKLALLRAHGMKRASLGVQSFIPSEVQTAGRAQRLADVERALVLMRDSGVPVRNIDLIYGIPGQDEASWRHSLEVALSHAPEELYLYPLYVRPLTGLERIQREPGDNREQLYRSGRDFLLEQGYRQISMRMFRRAAFAGFEEPVYVCQEDGMIGLGPGARSYTRELHYSSDYAVERASILRIVEMFADSAGVMGRFARHGAWLNRNEQQRRFVIKSLLRVEGLNAAEYRNRFGTCYLDDLPMLEELAGHDLAYVEREGARLNAEGMAWSDAIGPWLYSAAIRERMREYSWT